MHVCRMCKPQPVAIPYILNLGSHRGSYQGLHFEGNGVSALRKGHWRGCGSSPSAKCATCDVWSRHGPIFIPGRNVITLTRCNGCVKLQPQTWQRHDASKQTFFVWLYEHSSVEVPWTSCWIFCKYQWHNAMKALSTCKWHLLDPVHFPCSVTGWDSQISTFFQYEPGLNLPLLNWVADFLEDLLEIVQYLNRTKCAVKMISHK